MSNMYLEKIKEIIEYFANISPSDWSLWRQIGIEFLDFDFILMPTGFGREGGGG
jgi:hypothetical protein